MTRRNLRGLTTGTGPDEFVGEFVACGLAAFSGLVGGGVGEEGVAAGCPAGSGVGEVPMMRVVSSSAWSAMDATSPEDLAGRRAVSDSIVGERFISLGWGCLLSAGRSGAWLGFIDFAVSTPFGPMQRSRPGSC
jgi:hypothetical protein